MPESEELEKRSLVNIIFGPDEKYYVIVRAVPQGGIGPFDTIEEAETVMEDVISKMEQVSEPTPPDEWKDGPDRGDGQPPVAPTKKPEAAIDDEPIFE